MKATLIRSILKIGAGVFVAKGLTDESTAETIIAGLTALIAVFWGMLDRKPPTGAVPVKALGCLALLAGLVTLSGCASIKQNAETITTDPKTGIVEKRSTSASIVATGDAKQAVENLNGNATTKTASIGASGTSQESALSETLNALAALMGEMFKAGVAAGKTAVAPVP